MTASGVLAKAGETVAQSNYDKDPAYPKLTTKDAGKNPTTKTKKSSENVSVATVLLTSIGVLWTINKTHDLISALFGNPNFKIGMMLALSNYYNNENKLLRGSLFSPDRDLTYILRHFQRKPILIDTEPTETKDSKSLDNTSEELQQSYGRVDTPSNELYGYSENSPLEIEQEESNEKIECKTQTTFPIFKGLVTKMTDEEIGNLIEKGREFAESYQVISKLLLKRFDVLLIDACEGAAEKIKSLFSPKPEYAIE